MFPRLQRLWPCFLAVLFILSHTVDAKARPHPATTAAAPEKHHAVVEAQAILQSLKPFPNTSSSHSRPHTFLASLASHSKELFAWLFLNGPPVEAAAGSGAGPSLPEPLLSAVTLLQEASSAQDPDALYLLGDLSFYGKYGHPRAFGQAFHSYQALAALAGNASAQHMLGFMHATGVGGVVEKDQAQALLYHTFAAEGGDTRAQMTVAYRHHVGIATPRNCAKAVSYYKKVADKAIAYLHSGPPGGVQLVKDAYRLADEEGGVYGEGASVSSAGFNAKQGGPTTDANAAFDDVLEYLDLMSRKGELKATFGLGRLHYEGSRALAQDYGAAKDFFLEVARKYWTKDGKIRSDPEPGLDKLAAKAAGYLGRMFLRGEGMEQNFTKAKIWFKRGIENGDALCQYSLGLMYLHGHGTDSDPVRAAQYFGAAADQDMTSAQVRLGALLMDQGDLASATKYFEIALRNGHIEAFYYLAEIHRLGAGREASCSIAASYYKIVAEKAEPIHSQFPLANAAFESGDTDAALTFYMLAAEQGYEVAQANVAYLLDRPRPASRLASILPIVKRRAGSLADAALALIYWTRSARQANVDSLVKMGDYYLLGLGTAADAEKAAACYQAAAETLQSAQAMWNLGWMHENGIGLDQDFHLAKRHYDQSLDTNQQEAYLPVTLALMKLRLRSAWNSLVGGKVNSIQPDADPRRRYSVREWISQFLQAELEQYAADLERDDAAAAAAGDEWDAAGSMHDGELYEEIEEGVMEMLIILGLAGALAALLWVRARMHERANRAPNANADAPGHAAPPPPPPPPQEAGEERGVFPRPGDAEWDNWIAGGVGR